MITMLDIILYLAREDSLANPGLALNSPLSVLFPSLSQAVEHVHPRTSLCQALDIMLDGVQHLVVPITKRRKQGKPIKIPGPLTSTDLPSEDYCWITQEDVLRYLLSSLGTFYPLPMMSLEELGIINSDVMIVDANSPASGAMPLILRASREMTAVAVVVGNQIEDWAKRRVDGKRPRLVGDISMHTVRGCNDTAAAALSTLSVKEFLQYVHDAGGPPVHLVEKVVNRLKQRALRRAGPGLRRRLIVDEVDNLDVRLSSMFSGMSTDEDSDTSDSMSDYSSSDEETAGTSPEGPLMVPGASLVKQILGRSIMSQARSRTLVTCRPQSSLVAVMAQALAHRVNHVWVTDAEGGVIGIVTYTDMIDVLLSQLHSSE